MLGKQITSKNKIISMIENKVMFQEELVMQASTDISGGSDAVF